MTKVAASRHGALALAAVVAALVAALTARPADAGTTATAPTISTAKSSSLGKIVLVTRKGLTLYSLSVERHGRFICTDSSCLSFWTPLVVKKGAKPTGIAGLGTIRRPGG